MLEGLLFSAKCSIVFVSETWLKGETSGGLLLYNSDYNIIRHDKTDARAGGVCAFIKYGYSYICISLPQEFLHLEVLCFDLLCIDFKHRFICVYIPPNYDLLQTRDLTECLNVLCDIDHVVTICGDFNFREIDWAQIINISTLPLCASEFASFVANNGFTQLIKQPTRKNEILDLLTVNESVAIYDVTVLQPFSSSDYCALAWRTWFPQVTQVVGDPGYDFKRANYAMLSNYFLNVDWLLLFTQVPLNDVEVIWQILKSIVTLAVVLHVPRRVIHAKVANRYPPYIQHAIRLKRTLWRNRHYAGGQVRYTIQTRKCKRLIKR